MKKEFADLKQFIREQEVLTRRTILKNSQKNDHHAIKTQWLKFIKREKREKHLRNKYPAVAKAYRNYKDPRDCHYHEFEDWQFDWLLEKAGWEIKARKKWTNPTNKIGFRPILRWFTPRYYIVYAEKK